jgi:hypothetical protein
MGARVGVAYDRSRAGRRLAGRLRRALIDTTPARWRLGQLLVGAPLALLTTAVFGAAAGLAIAAGSVRTGGRLALRVRACRRAEALERGAALLARCLGAELAAGASAEDALAAAAASLPATERPLRAVAGAAVVRTTLGEAPGAALAAAAAGVEGGLEARGLAAVAGLLSLHGRAGGNPGSFDRLAAALDAAIATRDDARAVTAETRLAAVAVPSLAGVLAITLVGTEPAIAAGVTSPLPAGLLGGCVAVALGGTVIARRLAAVE